MPELQLLPGPRLVLKSWQAGDDGGPGEWVSTDVTNRAGEFLFSEVQIDQDFTVGDLFGLVMDEPIMQTVFRQEFVAELSAEVRKGPAAKDGKDQQNIEYLELYQVWNHDTSSNAYHGVGRYHLHGVGFVQEEDVYEHGRLAYKEGERIQWGVSLTPARELLNLPIHVRADVSICEDDIDAKRYGETLYTGTNEYLTLGNFIREILWELSWHGSPEDSETVSQGLREQMAEIDAGTAKTTSHEDVFEALGFLPKKVLYAKFFVGSEGISQDDVYHALHTLEDAESAQEGLTRLLEDRLQLRQEFATLTGRELRKAIREAKHSRADLTA